MLRFLLEERALAIHRVVVGESVRFPELGRAFYENGPAVFRRAFGALAGRARHAAGRLAVADPAGAPTSSSACCAGGLYSRAQRSG